MTRLRPHAHRIRQALGVVVGLTALAIAFNVDRHFQTAIPGYTQALQNKVEDSSTRAARARRSCAGTRARSQRPTSLHELRPGAASSTGLTNWINSKPLTLKQLRGKVVLIDFWTYSCINCLRTLPHVKAWYRTYHDRGLVVIGVHTPEFAFEHVPSNVRSAVRRLGVTLPGCAGQRLRDLERVPNQYWPAKYLIDRQRQPALLPLRRRLLRHDGGAHPNAPRRERRDAAGRERARPTRRRRG